MKYTFLVCLLFLSGCSSVIAPAPSVAPATEKPDACAEIYQPVCGEIQVQCIKAPCPPIKETFSNKCFAEMRGATNIIEGECS